MRRGIALIAAAVLAALILPAAAQEAPATYRVEGAAAGGLPVLALPEEGSETVATIPADTGVVDVVALSQDGAWGLVNAGELSGWVSMGFLVQLEGPPWQSLESGLTCLGTEPFWSLTVAPGGAQARFSSPEAVETAFPVADSAQAMGYLSPPLGLGLGEGGAAGFATIRGEVCSDGMSDRAFGLTIDLFRREGGVLTGYSGCCAVGAG